MNTYSKDFVTELLDAIHHMTWTDVYVRNGAIEVNRRRLPSYDKQ